MPDYKPPADFLRDAASLQRFMRLIYARSEDIERTHRTVTNIYLDYVRELGRATEGHLKKLLATEPDPRFSADDRQSLRPFRDFWRDIHEFVKPSRDADTLHTPVALIEQLEALLSKIPRLEKCHLLLCHTPEANYVQFVRSTRREKAEHYAAIVSGAPGFPQRIGFIAIPYSQESCLFQNLLICHEMGHFTFEELGLAETLSERIEAALDKHFPDLVDDPDSQTALSWCRELLWNWAEEIYCDRFAIGIIGPAYSFSYIEFFGVIGATTGSDVNDFTDTHPSDSCRFKEHSDELTRGGWWPLLNEHGKSHADLILQLSAIPEDQYVFVSDERAELNRRVLDAFREDVKPHIGDLVRGTFQGTEATFRGQADLECIKTVQRYLRAGVVPATLVRNGQLFTPDPALLINAAYLFHLYSVPELIDRIQTTGRERMDAVSEREKWGRLVEQWTMKALEDLLLPGRRAPWGSGVTEPESTVEFAVTPRGILTGEEMKQRQHLNVDDPSGLTITPLLEEDRAYDIDSLDVRLGTHFLFPRVPPRAYYCPDEHSGDSFHMRVHVPLGDYLVVPPHSTVLGATLEFIKLPFDVSGEILTKSSVARTFILIETAPWVHPNYRGCLTLEIANVSNTAILLYPGRKIGQMVLMHVAILPGREEKTAAMLDTTYFGPVFPEAPPFKNPEDDLFKIGVSPVMVIEGRKPRTPGGAGP